MNNRNFFIAAVILIIAAATALISYLPGREDIALKTKVSDFPQKIGGWSSTDVKVSDDVYRILETRNLFVREYKNAKGDSVFLYIVYSEDNRKVSHPPEVCLMGSGMSIVDKSSIPVSDSITANKLLVETANSRELVVYWFKAGSLNTDKYLKQQFKIVLGRLLGKRTSGALIRLSADIKNDNRQKTLNLLKSFISQIEPLLSKYVP